MKLDSIDIKLISLFRRISMPAARLSLFVVFFWFGILKVLGLSPASGVVANLLEATIPFMSPETFILSFGIFECVIGILFLVKGLERVVIPLLFVHMVTTFGPLVFLPTETWQGFMTPTLEGQYIIKNLVIIAVAIGIASNLTPMRKN